MNSHTKHPRSTRVYIVFGLKIWCDLLNWKSTNTRNQIILIYSAIVNYDCKRVEHEYHPEMPSNRSRPFRYIVNIWFDPMQNSSCLVDFLFRINGPARYIVSNDIVVVLVKTILHTVLSSIRYEERWKLQINKLLA